MLGAFCSIFPIIGLLALRTTLDEALAFPMPCAPGPLVVGPGKYSTTTTNRYLPTAVPSYGRQSTRRALGDPSGPMSPPQGPW